VLILVYKAIQFLLQLKLLAQKLRYLLNCLHYSLVVLLVLHRLQYCQRLLHQKFLPQKILRQWHQLLNLQNLQNQHLILFIHHFQHRLKRQYQNYRHPPHRIISIHWTFCRLWNRFRRNFFSIHRISYRSYYVNE
jgi:hypothetical protein